MPCPDCRLAGQPTGKQRCTFCKGAGECCPACGGKVKRAVCPQCNGAGTITNTVWVGGGGGGGRGRGFPIATEKVPCEMCGAKGGGYACAANCAKSPSIMLDVTCKTCNGTGSSGPCPTCKGSKKVPCTHCDSTPATTSAPAGGNLASVSSANAEFRSFADFAKAIPAVAWPKGARPADLQVQEAAGALAVTAGGKTVRLGASGAVQ